MIKTFTGKEIYDAFVKNGLDQMREEYLEVDENGKVIAGCLLTQAAVNLKAVPTDADELEEAIDVDGEYTLKHQLNRFYVPLKSRWWVNSVSSIGEAIIYHYDAINPDYDSYEEDGPDNRLYKLDTYEECLQMVKDLLEPHFEDTFELQVKKGGWTYPH